jgi:hypothetical protein
VRVSSGRVVLTRDEQQPYKVVLDFEDGGVSEHRVRTMQEAEAMIRQRLLPPVPFEVDRLRCSPDGYSSQNPQGLG